MPRTLGELAVERKIVDELSGLNSFESEAESRALVELARGKKVLEIGTFQGYSAVLMSRVAEVVHTVDWHRGGYELGEQDTLATAWRNIRAAHADNVVLFVGRSIDVLPWLMGPYDFAFIDGSHEYEDVREDILWSRPLCNALLFHDYGGYPGVTKAVDELSEEMGRPIVRVAGSLARVDLPGAKMRP